jgi:hypothetical protein
MTTCDAGVTYFKDSVLTIQLSGWEYDDVLHLVAARLVCRERARKKSIEQRGEGAGKSIKVEPVLKVIDVEHAPSRAPSVHRIQLQPKFKPGGEGEEPPRSRTGSKTSSRDYSPRSNSSTV